MGNLNSPEFLIAYNISKTLSKRNKAYLLSIEHYTRMGLGLCCASQERIGGRLSKYGYRQDIKMRQSKEAFGDIKKMLLIHCERPHRRATFRTTLTEIGKLTAMIIKDNCPEKIMDQRLGLDKTEVRKYESSVSKHMDRFNPPEVRAIGECTQKVIHRLRQNTHEVVGQIHAFPAPRNTKNPHLENDKSAPPNLNNINTHINKQPLTRETALGVSRDVVVYDRTQVSTEHVCFKSSLHDKYYGKIEQSGLMEHLSHEGKLRVSEAIKIKLEKGQTIVDPEKWAKGVCMKLLEEQKLNQSLQEEIRQKAKREINKTQEWIKQQYSIPSPTREFIVSQKAKLNDLRKSLGMSR